MIKVLIIDNYDSFTWNLYQMLGVASGTEPLVYRNDAIDVAGIRALSPTHLVISPGPGSPDKPRDFGVSAPAILELGPSVPILGVCLGHQGIIHHLGGRVVRAAEARHGKTSIVRHTGKGVFAGLPAEIEVMRYHSLLGEPSSLPSVLEVTAESTDDGAIMAVAHRTWPMQGVQFHPESVGTPLGPKLLEAFLATRLPSA